MAQPQTAWAEWKKHWPLVLASLVGMSFNSVVLYTLAIFMEPLSKEFGWSRSQVTAGLIIPGIIAVPLSPVIGAFIDRIGTRKIGVPGLFLGSLVLAAFGLANGTMWQWMGLWFLVGTIGLMMKSTIWTAAVTGVFEKSRGLAMGVVFSGVALTQIVAPPLTEWLVRYVGWREAYFILAAGWGGLALALAYFFLFDAVDIRKREAAAGQAPVALPGLTFREALRSKAIIKIFITTTIVMILTGGVMVHQVAILTDAGMSRQTAALIMSLAGFAGLVGKLLTGWLSDNWNARWTCAATVVAPALAFFLLVQPSRSPALLVLSLMILGYVIGAKLQVCAYLTSRYGGMRSFGKIFGIMSSVITVSAGAGPAMASASYDWTGSYTPLFAASIPFFIVAAWLVLTLGPYPTFEAPAAPEASPDKLDAKTSVTAQTSA